MCVPRLQIVSRWYYLPEYRGRALFSVRCPQWKQECHVKLQQSAGCREAAENTRQEVGSSWHPVCSFKIKKAFAQNNNCALQTVAKWHSFTLIYIQELYKREFENNSDIVISFGVILFLFWSLPLNVVSSVRKLVWASSVSWSWTHAQKWRRRIHVSKGVANLCATTWQNHEKLTEKKLFVM